LLKVIVIVPNVFRHVAGLLKMADVFALAFRTTELTRGHNTNNFAEAAMLIFKEVVLQR